MGTPIYWRENLTRQEFLTGGKLFLPGVIVALLLLSGCGQDDGATSGEYCAFSFLNPGLTCPQNTPLPDRVKIEGEVKNEHGDSVCALEALALNQPLNGICRIPCANKYRLKLTYFQENGNKDKTRLILTEYVKEDLQPGLQAGFRTLYSFTRNQANSDFDQDSDGINNLQEACQ